MKKRAASVLPSVLGLLAVVNLSACSMVVGIFESDVDPGGNGVDAGEGDVQCEHWAVQPRDLDPCSFVEPTGSLDLRDGPWRYDTATGTLTSPSNVTSTPTSELRSQSGGDDVRVLSVTDLRIRQSASLFATGPYPLLVLSFDGVRVEGLLSVASTRDDQGAGADSALCGDLRGESGGVENGIGSGGGGGSLRSQGGDGGDSEDSSGTSGGNGGDGDVVLSTFRGGCQGGGGGGAGGGEPGSGGGGLLLMARNYVLVQGQIGAGGQGAPLTPNGNNGGGGGGSGGVIAINAETVTVEAGGVLAANGGGGAQGSTLLSGQEGQDGQLSIEPALGGDDIGSNGTGGEGGALVDSDGSDGVDGFRFIGSGVGGGGGGGSVGEIILSAINLEVSPNATASPGITVP